MLGRGIIPAYAGSTGRRRSCGSRRRDHPRIRGEHARDRLDVGPFDGSSPHTRGARRSRHPGRSLPRIIPAYAGSTPSTRSWTSARSDHPRIRGEHDRHGLARTGRAGSSPHTRGARSPHPAHRQLGRIIPAYAGSTANTSRIRLGGPDHPRIRGEHISTSLRQEIASGSSPHTRGAPIPQGMDSGVGDHPRIRGEHHQRTLGRHQIRGSSPHTRGAQIRSEYSILLFRIIPAYAGSTCKSPGRSSSSSDHPRIRGEHLHALFTLAEFLGSSPHTRGAPPTSR